MESTLDATDSARTAVNVHQQPVSPEPAASPLLDKAAHNQNAPRGWPPAPKSITRSIYTNIWSGIVDVTLFGFSVAFLAFALIVNSYDKATTHNHPRAKERLFSASKYGPTVFPLLFAAVVSRATHSILVWRIERGERTGVLDMLAGSTSLTSTVTSQIRLRIFSLLGTALVIIWGMSPVGGQASFRQLSIGTLATSSPASYTYMAHSGDLGAYDVKYVKTLWATVNTLLGAAIIAPLVTRQSPLDLWGNVKIPRIEHFESIQEPDDKGWFDISLDGITDTGIYASLVGIPLSGLENSSYVDHKMNLQTVYLNFSCGESNYTEEIISPGAINVTGREDGSPMIWWVQSTNVRQDERYQYNQSEAFKFGWASLPAYHAPPEVECLIRSTYVEVNVLCPTRLSCLVSKIRRSTLPHPSPNFTQLDKTYNWKMFVDEFIAAITSPWTNPTMTDSTIVDYYVAMPDSLMSPTAITLWDASAPGPDTWAVRLGQMMNTYWTIANGPYAISGGLTDSTSFFDPNVVFTIDYCSRLTSCRNTSHADSQSPKAMTWSAEGTYNTNEEIIQAHKGWVTALAIASTILIIASLIPPIMRHFLIDGPELLINISSLATRNNPYIPLPANGTFMDASDRARLLKNHVIRFGDVDGGGDVGNLAVGSLNAKDTEGLDVERVRRKRLYV